MGTRVCRTSSPSPEELHRDLQALDAQPRRRIADALARHGEEPLRHARAMAASELGDHRFRIGDYRVILDLVGEGIVVLRVEHRREIYRR